MEKTCGGVRLLPVVVLVLGLFSTAVPSVLWSADTLQRPSLPSTADTQSIGTADYNWTILDLDGQEVPFSTFKNKVVFLHFWATWCPHCLLQLSSIQRLSKSVNGEDIVFVMASYEDQSVVRDYVAKKNITLPVYRYEAAVPPIFGPARQLPRTYIIDRKGQIVYEHIGAAGWDDELVLGFLRSLR